MFTLVRSLFDWSRGRVRRWVGDLQFKYNITLGLYMLDPWERLVFNFAALLIFTLVGISAYTQLQFLWNMFL